MSEQFIGSADGTLTALLIFSKGRFPAFPTGFSAAVRPEAEAEAEAEAEPVMWTVLDGKADVLMKVPYRHHTRTQ